MSTQERGRLQAATVTFISSRPWAGLGAAARKAILEGLLGNAVYHFALNEGAPVESVPIEGEDSLWATTFHGWKLPELGIYGVWTVQDDGSYVVSSEIKWPDREGNPTVTEIKLYAMTTGLHLVTVVARNETALTEEEATMGTPGPSIPHEEPEKG